MQINGLSDKLENNLIENKRNKETSFMFSFSVFGIKHIGAQP